MGLSYLLNFSALLSSVIKWDDSFLAKGLQTQVLMEAREGRAVENWTPREPRLCLRMLRVPRVPLGSSYQNTNQSRLFDFSREIRNRNFGIS